MDTTLSDFLDVAAIVISCLALILVWGQNKRLDRQLAQNKEQIKILKTEVGFVKRQLKEAERARNLQASLVATFYPDTDNLASPWQRKLRRYFYNLPTSYVGGDEKLDEAARQVCNSFDRVALLVRVGLISDYLVIRMYAQTIVRMWDKLYPFIMSEREKRGPDVEYLDEFEMLAQKASMYLDEELKDKKRQKDPME
jgi:hypothetical protein